MKKSFKRLAGILLAGVLTVGSMAVSAPAAHAEGTQELHTLEGELYQEGAVTAVDENYADYVHMEQPIEEGRITADKYLASFSNKVEQAIYRGLMNSLEEIDIASYGITEAQLSKYWDNILNTAPELFYVDGGIDYWVSKSTNRVTTLKPTYKASGSTLANQKSFYNSSMDKVVAGVKSSWTVEEKILYVHDYLAQHYQYDTSVIKGAADYNPDNAIYDAYNFFLKGKGVCQAYTLVFEGAMDKLGIQCSVADSEDMNHIWNVVKVGSSWYHVDVTWDDPLNNANCDVTGLAYHDNLLRSDKGISETEHYNWSSSYACASETYDKAFWKQVTSPFQYLKDTWYFIYYDDVNAMAALGSHQFTSGEDPKGLFPIGYWSDNSDKDYYWTMAFSGLSVFNNRLYYTTADTIYSYDPASQAAPTPELNPAPAGKSIYGTKILGNVLTYAIGTDPFSALTNGSKKLSAYRDPDHEVTMWGDADGDNKITMPDARLTMQAALSIIKPNDNVRNYMDVDQNGRVTLEDARLVMKRALSMIKKFPAEES